VGRLVRDSRDRRRGRIFLVGALLLEGLRRKLFLLVFVWGSWNKKRFKV